MAESELLAKLHDIHLPEPIGWWPPAPGWYFLLPMIILLLGLIRYLMYRIPQCKPAKPQALKLLESYEREYEIEGDSQKSAMKVSALLRRVALAYYPRKDVAGLQGEAWLAFLAQTAKGLDLNALNDGLSLSYQPIKNSHLKPFFLHARQWIKQRGRRCSK